jgi:hypothetical protein
MILESIMPNDSIDLDVYNLEKDRLKTHPFYMDLEKTAKSMDFTINVNLHNELLFNSKLFFVVNT